MKSWPLVRIADVCRLNPPRDPDLDPEAIVSFVPMAAVQAETGQMDLSETRINRELQRSSYRPFAENDILFAKITPCMENGKCAVAKGLVGGAGYGSTEFHVLRSNSSLEPRFLMHYLLQRSFREDARKHMTGSAGQLRVPATYLANATIPLPPIEEQQRIVATIEAHFSHLYAAEIAIGRADALAVMTVQALAESLAREGEPRSLGELCDVITGGTPSTSDPSLWGGDTPFITPGDLVHGEAVTRARRSLTGLGKEKARVVPAQSVLVTCIGATIGKTSISQVECAVNQQINALVPDRSLVLPKWLNAAVSSLSFQALIRGNASSTTMPILNKSKFQNLRIRVPSLETQAVMVAKYQEVHAKLSHARAAMNRVKHMSNAMRRGVLKAAFGASPAA